jgi:riboflavin kinase/FMN adenylyltransferase
MVSGGRPLVAAIGNFDGVHRGHLRLLAETARFAQRLRADPAAVVFDPHPRRFFRPDDPPFLLTTGMRRDALLRAAGAAAVLPIAFDAALAGLTPDAFVADVLKARLGLKGVVTGTDFRFGKARAGDAAFLERAGAAAGLDVLAVAPKIEAPGESKIGSSAIRALIAAGEVGEAALMLGRRWAVEGVVAAGQKLGRTLGFPTANLTLGDLVEPRHGVYAVTAVLAGARHGGVANFGRRPTVGASAPLLEVHLFDFTGDIYGKRLDVAFVAFIRDERKFDGLDALQRQIAADCASARRILELNPS